MAEAHLLIPEKLADMFSEFTKALAREMRDSGVGLDPLDDPGRDG